MNLFIEEYNMSKNRSFYGKNLKFSETTYGMECSFKLFPHQKKLLHFLHSREINMLEFIKELNEFNNSKFFENTFDHMKNPVIIPGIDAQKDYFFKEYFANEVIKNMRDELESNIIIFKKDFGIPLNIRLPVGAGKSYIALSVIDKLPSYDIYYKNYMVVPCKLMNQWENYVKNSGIKCKFYSIKTRKNAGDFNNINFEFIPEGIFVLISHTMSSYISFKTKGLFRLYVDEIHSLILSKTSTENICDISLGKAVMSSTSLFKYFTCANYNRDFWVTIDEELITFNKNIPEFIHNIKIIKNELYKYILTLNCKESTIRKFEIDIFDSSEELFQNIFAEKVEQSKNLEKTLEKLKIKFQKAQEKNKEKSIEKYKNEINEHNKELDKITSEINNLKERILNDTCPICLRKIFRKQKISKKTGVMKTKRYPMLLICCKISICNECIKKIDKCIYCKNNIKEKYNDKEENFFKMKIDEICKINFPEDSKIVLIGDDYNPLNICTLEEISYRLFSDKKYIKSISGAAFNCMNILEKFKVTDEIKMIYFPNLYQLVGFNMEYITHLIIMKELREDIKNQIIGRFQRIGRTESLNVYEFHYE
jgi:hypothetical protein